MPYLATTASAQTLPPAHLTDANDLECTHLDTQKHDAYLTRLEQLHEGTWLV